MIILNIYIILISSITIFLIVVLLFIILLLFAKSKLTSAENVVIKINSDKELIIQQGETLLRTLSNEKIYIPSACGGKGTCGLCKCRVSNGGGSVLPTETSLLSRKEQENQWRLACQVKVKNDLEIILPDSILDIKKYECTVISNNNVATFIKELIVKLPENEILKFQSGEYIQIDVPKIKVNFKSDILIDEKYLNDWNKLNIFNLKMENSEETSRAYSMANSPSENNIIKLNVRITTPPFNNKKQKFRKINP
ncbi:MAG: NADH:ubiquinone reductase (Na(+)-transporting) subunit F, partial [Bacteroidales bacterium]|nr:NADH:ubiquinone reductase (Na(+)-transporting) subunit F [Bacteroidales bacterium]